MTATGTNLLGLIKHNATWDARYFGEVFDRPFPEPLPRWDDISAFGTDHWATDHETRADVVDLTRHAGHADILREGLDGAVGVNAKSGPKHGFDDTLSEARRIEIERVAQAFRSGRGGGQD